MNHSTKIFFKNLFLHSNTVDSINKSSTDKDVPEKRIEKQKRKKKSKTKLVEGQSVFVLARIFGTEWAKKKFGTSWKSARIEGKLQKYIKDKGMWVIYFSFDSSVCQLSEKFFL